MNAYKLAAIALIVIGVLALAYGGFTYTKDTSEANIGPLQLTVKDRERVNIPIWAGVGLVVTGAGMLAYPFIKR